MASTKKSATTSPKKKSTKSTGTQGATTKKVSQQSNPQKNIEQLESGKRTEMNLVMILLGVLAGIFMLMALVILLVTGLQPDTDDNDRNTSDTKEYTPPSEEFRENILETFEY